MKISRDITLGIQLLITQSCVYKHQMSITSFSIILFIYLFYNSFKARLCSNVFRHSRHLHDFTTCFFTHLPLLSCHTLPLRFFTFYQAKSYYTTLPSVLCHDSRYPQVLSEGSRVPRLPPLSRHCFLRPRVLL